MGARGHGYRCPGDRRLRHHPRHQLRAAPRAGKLAAWSDGTERHHGVAWSLVEPAEGKQLGAIERLQRIDIPRLDAPEGFAPVELQTQGATRRGGRSGGAGGARQAPPQAPGPER